MSDYAFLHRDMCNIIKKTFAAVTFEGSLVCEPTRFANLVAKMFVK